ncbi:hypothetical protein G6011_01609 [Alternaria panax]|uniref:Uncharacterized protein n=1 Tax=Alternaria panax TaxID=48097 RepID=A0AAD4IKK8_9PLEO|nr:hypothetical protein G6011_01609 [Alternaria panax]
MGTTMMSDVDFVEEADVLGIMELFTRELECEGRPRRLLQKDVSSGFLEVEVKNGDTELWKRLRLKKAQDRAGPNHKVTQGSMLK